MQPYDDYKHLLFARNGKVLTITINLPATLNAVNGPLHNELSRVFRDVAADAESDIVVLTGAGRAFCAGGDLDWMQAAIDQPAEFERTVVEAKTIVFSMLDLEKPIICRLNGHAMGLGATIALFCDIIIAADTAKIGDPHVSVGLVAGDGGAVIWPQLIGYAKAKEFLLTGDALPATEAARIGLINKAVPLADLDAEVAAIANRLAAGATKAIRWTKVTINAGLKQIAHMAMDTGLAYEIASNGTRDHQEAVNAFREKRKPVFNGS